jgi:ankyrin repeat protein
LLQQLKARDSEGRTPLHLAAASGCITAVKALLMALARAEETVAAQEEDGEMMAAQEDEWVAAKFVTAAAISLAAFSSLQDRNGKTGE